MSKLTPEGRAHLAMALAGRVVPEAAARNIEAWVEADRAARDWHAKIAADRAMELSRPVTLDLGCRGSVEISRGAFEKICGTFGVDEFVEFAEELLVALLDESAIELPGERWDWEE